MQASAFLCSLTKAVLPVSHFKERKETNCLNCNAEVLGKYCYVCGQENTPPRQSVGHLINHFLNDITHFDGKFFATLGTLIRRPGLLTLEYVRGRRVSYLDPVRMYIFSSALFFLVLFNRIHIEKAFERTDEETSVNYVKNLNDSSLKAYSYKKYGTLLNRQELVKDARLRDSLGKRYGTIISFYKIDVQTVAAYDSLQLTFPEKQRDGLWKRSWIHSQLRVNAANRADPKHFMGKLAGRFFHFFPQMLFVSLPLFALLLQLLYRRRKTFYYTDHVIFTIHLYIFTFISLLALFALKKLEYGKGYTIIDFLRILIVAGIFIYQYKAMRHFYQQRRGKTILKFLLLNCMATFMMLLLFLIFFIFSSATFE